MKQNDSAPGSRPAWGSGAWIILALLVGAVLRFSDLNRLPLWNDEQWQFQGIQCPADQMRQHLMTSAEFTPPLSFLIQRAFWLMRQSLWDARVPGALAGVLGLWLAARLVRREEDSVAAGWVAWMTATGFVLVYYAQELRGYVFFSVAALWMISETIAAIDQIREGRLGRGVWIRFCAAGVLAGLFHTMALALAAILGIVSVLFSLRREFFTRAGWPRLRGWIARIGVWALAHGGIAIVTFLIAHYYAGPKLSAAVQANRTVLATPAWGDILSLLYKFSWGSDGAMGAWVVVLAASVVPLRIPGGRRLAAVLLTIAGLSVACSAWVFPRIGFYAFNPEYATRHMIWISWCIWIIAGLGLWRMLRFLRMKCPPAAGHVAVAAVLAMVVFLQVRPLAQYYRMDCKREPIPALQAALNALDLQRRTLALANVYDWHYLWTYLQGQRPVCAAPPHEQADYDALKINDWLVRLVTLYPDVALKTTYYHPFDPPVSAALSNTMAKTVLVAPNAAAETLDRLGIKPLKGISERVYFNNAGDLAKRARAMGRPVCTLPGEVPFATFRRWDGGYDIARVFGGAVPLRVWSSWEQPGWCRIRFAVFGGAESCEVRVRSPGRTTPLVKTLPPRPALLPDPVTGREQRNLLSVAAALQVPPHIPISLPWHVVEFQANLDPGLNRFEIIAPESGLLWMPVDEENPPDKTPPILSY